MRIHDGVEAVKSNRSCASFFLFFLGFRCNFALLGRGAVLRITVYTGIMVFFFVPSRDLGGEF